MTKITEGNSDYYQLIFENSYDAIFIETLDGQIVDANPAACRLLGYSRVELLALNVAQLLPPGNDEPVECIIRRTIDTGSFTGSNVRKDGSQVPIELRLNRLVKNGQELAIVIVRDITARFEADMQARREKLVFESLHAMAVGLMQRKHLLDVLNSIIEHACKLLATPDGFIYMAADDPAFAEVKVGTGVYTAHVGYKVRLGKGLVGKVWLSGEPAVIENYQTWEGRIDDPRWANLQTVVGIPLKSRGEVVGVIGLDIFGQSKSFSKNNVAMFERLAELASIAIDSAYLSDALRESEESFHSLFSNMSEGVALHQIIMDEAGRPADYRIIDVNPRYEQIVGLKRDDVVGKLATEAYRIPNPPYLREISGTVLTGVPKYFETYFLPLVKYLAISVVPLKEKGFAIIFTDITQRKQAEENLLSMSYRDALTGVYNRAYFEAQLKSLDSPDGMSALFICDVDGLKLTNDMFGHEEGDRLLITAIDFLQRQFRPEDIVARIGGDEFSIIMKNVTAEEVERISAQIRYNLAQLPLEETTRIPLQISFGYALTTEAGNNALELFRIADNRMYRDKLRRRSPRGTIVQTLKQMLAERDYLTGGHAERMQEMVLDLARVLGIPEKNMGDLRLFAHFHDIGKVGIPDRILQTPGPLSTKERAEMRRHCEIGQRIAQSSDDLFTISDWILKHHEHWDGNGYPLGLRDEEIPLECRILAIADAYDAMTNDRPYRRAMSHDRAIAELRRCAGTQFDPDLVEIFIGTVKGIND